MGKVGSIPPSKDALGAHLARLRTAAGLSLRQVEKATKKEVSNAYLSQLENNRISKPSPNILYALAEVYKTSYEDLMARAGHFSSSGRKVAPLAIGDITSEEETALLEYLAFYRQQQRRK
jgi:transcriptional regulator with XRE-family HTH domain